MSPNDMVLLAADRRRELHAEAERARLARSAPRQAAPLTPARPRSALRTSLGQLLGRPSA